MGLITWIIMGLLVGTIARAIMRHSGGWVSTLAFGVLGGVVGGWIGDLVGHRGGMNLFSLWSWVLSTLGAVIVILVVRAITRTKAR